MSAEVEADVGLWDDFGEERLVGVDLDVAEVGVIDGAVVELLDSIGEGELVGVDVVKVGVTVRL